MTRAVIDHPLVSHHLEPKHYRTVLLVLPGLSIRICARCTGITIGSIAGLAWLSTGQHIAAWWALFGVIDWLAYRFGIWRGTTTVRIGAGVLLGLYQALLLASIIHWHFPSETLMAGCILLMIYIIGGMSRIGYSHDDELQWLGWRCFSKC